MSEKVPYFEISCVLTIRAKTVPIAGRGAVDSVREEVQAVHLAVQRTLETIGYGVDEKGQALPDQMSVRTSQRLVTPGMGSTPVLLDGNDKSP